jgi:hypothetical protein
MMVSRHTGIAVAETYELLRALRTPHPQPIEACSPKCEM